MENKNISLLVGAFVMLIIGVSLIAVVAGEGNNVTERTAVQNELINIGTARMGLSGYGSINESVSTFTVDNTLNRDCPVVFGTYGNGTINLTLDTDYTVNGAAGQITVLNTSTTNASLSNNTYVSYTYCGTGYVNSSFGRTGIDLVSGFFAIALMLGAVGMFYMVLKNEGLGGL